MRNVIKAAIVALVIALATPVAAQDFDTGLEAYQRGDYTAALSEFRPLADQGLATAQNNLGIMYHTGQGVVQDNAEGLRWFRMAADARARSRQSTRTSLQTGGEHLSRIPLLSDSRESTRRRRVALPCHGHPRAATGAPAHAEGRSPNRAGFCETNRH